MRQGSFRAAAIAGLSSLCLAGIAFAAGPFGNKVVHPTVEVALSRAAGLGVAASHAGTAAGALPGSLVYRGAVAGVGVTTGAPKVYLVFWGSQWGTQGTDSAGNLTFSGDINGAAPYLQNFFKGLGGNGELWSGVMTQSCETVAGSTTCPASAQHVGYPGGAALGGALAGVWYDPAGAISATGNTSDADIAREALRAAQQFGNTQPAQNRNVQYVILSPPGTHPGGFSASAGWCAWHDWNGDTTMNGGAVASPYGNFAFTNFPYVSDLGTSCGQNYVNAGSAGLLDGFSIVEGHEYSETITDQFPAGGWTDSSGWENADKCSWIGTGGVTGGATNLVLSTGTFAVQGQWLNNTSNCSTAYARYSGTPNVISVSTTPSGTQSVLRGTAIAPVQVTASGTTNSTGFTYTATGLPAGLTLGSTTGLIQGTPTTSGSYSSWITAADASGAVGYGSINWVVTGTTVTVTAPANQTSIKGVAVSGVQPAAVSSSGQTGFSWSASGLPSGIGINTSTGAITGTPTTVQSARTVTLTAKDVTGSTGSASFTWTVVNTTVTVAPIANQTTKRGTAVSLTATATDSNPALSTFTWSASGLPSGLSMGSSTGKISGTISSNATLKTYTVTVTAKDANGASGSKSFTWTVQ